MARFRSVKYRIYPSRSQTRQMNSTLEHCRTVYNREIEMCRKAYESNKIFPSQESIQDYCDYVLKLDDPCLESVFPDCLEDVSRRVCRSFERYIHLLKSGKDDLALPSCKGPERYRSFAYPRFKGNVRLSSDGRIWLHGLGNMRCVIHRPIEGSPISCTLSKSSTDKWFAIVSFIKDEKTGIDANPNHGQPVGMDLGLFNLAVFSDGTVYDNKKLFDRMTTEMGRIQRKMNGCPVGSEEHERCKRRLNHLFEHYNNQVKDEMHKRSTEIVATYSMIALEDIDVKGMIEHYHTRAGRRSQSTAAWRTFVKMIDYKAEESGVDIVFVDPRYTSQTCSRCGSFVAKDLSIRVHDCPICGLKIDRDVNAAKNILRLGLGMQASVTGNRNSRISI